MKANFYKCVVIFLCFAYNVDDNGSRYADDCFDRNRQL